MTTLESGASRAEVTRAGAGQGRLAFLDALRGVAALGVALSHRFEATWPGYASFHEHVFGLGRFGVVLFFLCSGFIIPASLERGLRDFWTGRVFRLFPLYLVALAAALGLALAGPLAVPEAFWDHPVLYAAVNAAMVPALLGVPAIIGLSWTLSFELLFYVLMSVLFVLGLHRRGLALTMVATGVVAATGALEFGLPVLAMVLTALVVAPAAAGAWRVVTPRRRVGLMLLAALVVVAVGNRSGEVWLNASLIACLFAGTVLFRHSRGELPGPVAAAAFTLAGVTISLSVLANADQPSYGPTTAASFAVFGVSYLARARRFPRALVALGLVSYSVYLVHPLVYAVLPPFGVAGVVAGSAVTILLASATYRYVERPANEYGRRLRERRRARPTSTRSTRPGARRPG